MSTAKLLAALGYCEEQIGKAWRRRFFHVAQALIFMHGEHDDGRYATSGYPLGFAGKGGGNNGAESILGVLKGPLDHEDFSVPLKRLDYSSSQIDCQAVLVQGLNRQRCAVIESRMVLSVECPMGATGMGARRINAIIHGQRSITAETALLFSRFFGNSAEFWMGLQSQYDLEREQDRLAERLNQVPEHGARATA